MLAPLLRHYDYDVIDTFALIFATLCHAAAAAISPRQLMIFFAVMPRWLPP